MATVYPKSLLIKFLHLSLGHPEQLTDHETEIASRICVCALCDNTWLRRRKKLPQRCPACHKWSWNRPLLEAMKAKEDAAAAARKEPTP